MPEGSLIIQVGVLPPPYGGVSMRIKRLAAVLNAGGVRCFVFSPRQRANQPGMISIFEFLSALLKNGFSRNGRLLIHLQHTNLQTFRLKWYALVRLVRLCGAKVVVSLGGLWYELAEVSLFRRFWFKRINKQVDKYVAVGSPIAEKLIRGGCPKEKVSVIPGFVPPDEEELLNGKAMAGDLEIFLKKHDPVIVANASGVVFHNGRDLYGLDMCIELTVRLYRYFGKLGLIYAIAPGGHGASTDDWDYLEEMRRLLNRQEVADNFYFRICSEPLTPLMKRCDIFVRPTCTDGDSNSIREALYLGKPVVASDAAPRPEGCVIFQDGNVLEFTEKVDMILRDYKSHEKRINELRISLPHHDLLRLYSQLLEE